MDPRHRSASYSQETPGGFTLDQSLGVRPTANANAAFIEHAFVDGQPTSLRQHEAALGLTQVRRHSASVAAAPLHGSSFKSSEIGTTKLARSASWAPESPTRKYSVTHCGKSHEKKNAEFGWFKRMRESRFFTSRIIKRNKMEFCKRMLMCISRVQASETQLAHSFMSSILRSTSHWLPCSASPSTFSIVVHVGLFCRCWVQVLLWRRLLGCLDFGLSLPMLRNGVAEYEDSESTDSCWRIATINLLDCLVVVLPACLNGVL